MPRGRVISPKRHTIFRLAPDLLLVFKPNGHRELAHCHDYAQELQIVRGRLAIAQGRRRRVLRSTSPRLRISAGERHSTRALEDTWLIAQALRQGKENR